MNPLAATTPAAPASESAPAKSGLPHFTALTTLDVVDVAKRQFWLITAAASLGLLISVIYWSKAEPWYETRAKMLVTLQDPRLTSDANSSKVGDNSVQDDILASHMEIVSGRELLKAALAHEHLTELPSILEKLDEETDAIDYVSEHLLLTKGGQGTARDARTLNIAFRHTHPDDAVLVLDAIVKEYEASLNASLTKAMETATKLIQDAQTKVDGEIKELQAQYVAFSQKAPVMYRQGNGTSNIFQAKLQFYQTQMAEIEAKKALTITRVENVNESIARIEKGGTSISRLEKMSLIDSETFERLGTIAQLQVAAGQSPDFIALAPVRLQAAQLEIQTLTNLEADYNRLKENFGDNHSTVRSLKAQIESAKEKLYQSNQRSVVPTMFAETSPEDMLGYYQQFLNNDLKTLQQTQLRLTILSDEAERQAQQAVEFEVADRMMQSDIERKQQLYTGIVEHLQSLNTASGLTGFVHQKLVTPERGKEVWPELSVCVIAGCMLGLIAGVFLAMMNDQVDKRFRSPSEIDQLTGVPVIAQVGRIRRSRDQRRSGRLIVDPQAPEAESFRLLRTFLLKDVKSGRLRILSATSCQTKDGKSTILANIAATFAETGMKTVIIDGDMRAPTSHRFFNIPIQNGLSELLQGKITADEALKSTGINGLSAITAGSAVRNPAELLQSVEFDELLGRLRAEFDFVVIDSGPVLWVSDPAIVAQKADATLLVVRSSTDTKRKVQEAVRRLHAANANLRGCVLNTFGSAKEFTQDTYYSSPYHYYYGGYGRRVKDAPNGNGNGKDSPHSKAEGPAAAENGHSDNGLRSR